MALLPAAGCQAAALTDLLTISEVDKASAHPLPAGDIFERSFATSALHGGGVAELRQYLFDRCLPATPVRLLHSTGILCTLEPHSDVQSFIMRACRPLAAAAAARVKTPTCPPAFAAHADSRLMMVLQGRALGVAAREHRGRRQPRGARSRPGGGAGGPLLLWTYIRADLRAAHVHVSGLTIGCTAEPMYPSYYSSRSSCFGCCQVSCRTI